MDVISERGYAGERYYSGEKIVARQVAEWLHFRRLSLPAGSQTVHHLDSHDTFWWGEKAQFRKEAFGVEASRALFAMFALLDGGIMNYVGAEKGSEDFYRNLLRLRQRIPALRVGDCDYLAVGAEPESVLALLRSYEGDFFIPVINLGPTPVTATLSLPAGTLDLEDSSTWLVYDVFNHVSIRHEGQTGIPEGLSPDLVDRLKVSLPSYGVRILRFNSVRFPDSAN